MIPRKEYHLGNVVDVVKEKISLNNRTDFERYIAGEHIDSGEIKISGFGLIKNNEKVIGPAFHMRFKPGHVLYSTRRAYLRKAAIVDFEGICSNVTLVLKSDEKKLLQTLLPFILQTEDFVQHAINKSIGSTNPFVKWTDLAKFRIRLPDVPYQEKMSRVLWSMEKNIDCLKNLKKIIDDLKNGLIFDHLGLSNRFGEFMVPVLENVPNDWKIMKLYDIISDKQNGFASGKRDENGIPQIRMNNITTNGELDLINYLKVPIPSNIEKYMLKDNDILFNNTNSVDLVGKSAIFHKQNTDWTFSNHFTRFRVNTDIIFPEIFHYYLVIWQNCGYFNYIAQRHVGQSAVPIDDLLKIKIFIPPKNKQKMLVNLITKIDQQIKNYDDYITSLGRLKMKLANMFFKGEIF